MVGVQGVVHLGQIQSGLRSAIRIVQVKDYTSIYCPGKKLYIYLLSRKKIIHLFIVKVKNYFPDKSTNKRKTTKTIANASRHICIF